MPRRVLFDAGAPAAASAAATLADEYDVQPWAVDASSQLELSPGVKDHDRVRAFVEAVRS